VTTPTPGQTWVQTAPQIRPPRYGLFSVADFTEGAGTWQIRGVEYFTDACAQGGFVMGSCPQPVGTDGATTHDKPTAEGLNLVQGSGVFTVYARAECNAVAFDDPQGLATRRLGLIEQRYVERFFSQYVLGAADPPADFPLGQAATTLKDAIGTLEAHAALNYAGAPTFHAARWASPYFDFSFRTDTGNAGETLHTLLGSPVAFGGGYYLNPFDPGQPPPDGQFWLVATGSVRGWRSEAFVNETFTPSSNTRMAIAERTYALDADCYRAAVLVDTTGGA
jgi:hypothetical protein